MSTETPPTDPPAGPPAGPPADHPTDPPASPPVDTSTSELRSIIDGVMTRLEELTTRVAAIEPANGPQDETPVKRPWTARGRK